ncbi:alkanesulfonate monooxygenase SsuD/methylene tetrahydromethanopterin reductase-like flavin-dependent oxidoreductase (luciferase family) [Actinoplanes lutulentus]|uniref:LLM class flavin-dependent oxidoreductase n=1 Tax=Actinoplanes lutulentus TaxID=1287878 RepID=UPI0017C33D06|nr:LLM class flavin-dependent oxidoreductase [Actinoplanes lutulentus]MBB2946919.1 alkanesulfonate monooxygenase SsuD/methylene tetrahydromethanopterin reductase-like flavin-dependent oxidoreductase (luciferase family) [Actinoplanes lutulentus]
MTQLHLAVALDGAGWHPAAWRTPQARPRDLLTAGYWSGLLAEAERGLLDFATIDDSLTIQSADPFAPDERTDQVRGRLDAVGIAARVAPVTEYIGVVPVVTTTHTEPFHTAKNIATLDYVSTGRAGVQIRTGGFGGEAALFGRRELPDLNLRLLNTPEIQQFVAERFDEAADYVEVVRRLWDSWQDDAEIRDVTTGRFIDRDRLHRINFEGRWFSVRGPSITPRPPQGQPLVTALGHATVPYRLAARQADVLFVTPLDTAGAIRIRDEVLREVAAAGRDGQLKIFADLLVHLDTDKARPDKARPDKAATSDHVSDARILAGSVTTIADHIEELHQLGYDGVRLRPGVLPDDLTAITGLLVPELQRRGLFRTRYTSSTLRGHLGLDRPTSRYQPV